jgi:3-phenylpropionate/trans-cinnamate dioxygenase ferredoxin reductase subunit
LQRTAGPRRETHELSGLVIIGASYAGVQTALSAREAGYAEPIRIISNEDTLPYQRPPLSKAYILTDLAESKLVLRGEKFFTDKKIDLLLNTRATRIDRDSKRVELEGQSPIGFDKLVIATGSRARLLPSAAAAHNIFYLRSLADARALKAHLPQAAELVVIGGGFIGLEVAASAAKLGKKVTVIESATRLIERALSPVLSQYLRDIHESHGVTIRFSETVTGVAANGSRTEIHCANGDKLNADLVLVGIGGIPNSELASEAGVACENGIVVDAFGISGSPDVLAAGDCTSHYNALVKRNIRLESVQHAQDQAKSAGAAIAGARISYTAIPRFWSDQYDAKLQMVGLSEGHDRHVIRGSIADGKFSVFLFRSGRLVAIDSVNRPGDQLIGRRLIASGTAITPEQAADVAFDLKSLASEEVHGE